VPDRERQSGEYGIEEPVARAFAVEDREPPVLPERKRSFAIDRFVRKDPEPVDSPAGEPVQQRRGADDGGERGC
jgi:hypothetical protein